MSRESEEERSQAVAKREKFFESFDDRTESALHHRKAQAALEMMKRLEAERAADMITVQRRNCTISYTRGSHRFDDANETG